MSKFNTSNADMNKTTNRCGNPAYVMSLKEKLVTQGKRSINHIFKK